MLDIIPERAAHILQRYWHGLPEAYRTPVILSSCAVLLLTPFAWEKFTYTPELLPPPPKDYQYRLHLTAKAGSSSFTLPDGRVIGYAQYGRPTGKPIISLHGILGSRLESALFDAHAQELGAQIIAIERPGIGLSSPDPRPLQDRRVLDHAKDVEALAEHLELDEYAVLGTSGGGPYALGCAHALPSSPSKPRLRGVTIVTGLGLADMSQAWPRPLVFLNRHLDLRWLLQRLFTRGPAWQLDLSDEERLEGMRKAFDIKKAHPADIETAKCAEYPDWVQLFLCSAREAVAQGYGGFLDDSALLSKDPGFRVEDIREDLPVQLWYGTDDTNVSPKAGEETLDRLKAGELQMIQGGTHGSTQVKCRKEVIQTLLKTFDCLGGDRYSQVTV